MYKITEHDLDESQRHALDELRRGKFGAALYRGAHQAARAFLAEWAADDPDCLDDVDQILRELLDAGSQELIVFLREQDLPAVVDEAREMILCSEPVEEVAR